MKVIFAGTPAFAVPALQMLIDSSNEVLAVYTQPDRPAGRGRKILPGPVKQLATQAGIPVFQPESLAKEGVLQQLRVFAADIMVVVAYGMILTQDVLDTPKKGCLNIHASLLPRWRGAAPIQRALMAGDQQTGITVMQIVNKLDAGDILHMEYCDITDQDTSADLHDRLALLGAAGLKKVLDQLDSYLQTAIKQDETRVTYAEKLHKNEAVLDWNWSALQLDRTIRGLNPWPVAQTRYKDKILRIWKAAAVKGEPHCDPGTVRCHDRQVDVATGDGWLRLLEVQLPGGKKTDIQAFTNAHPVDGVILGG